jgi:hypothetical protein
MSRGDSHIVSLNGRGGKRGSHFLQENAVEDCRFSGEIAEQSAGAMDDSGQVGLKLRFA